jgi:hypothetical protein
MEKNDLRDKHPGSATLVFRYLGRRVPPEYGEGGEGGVYPPGHGHVRQQHEFLDQPVRVPSLLQPANSEIFKNRLEKLHRWKLHGDPVKVRDNEENEKHPA